MGERNIDAVVAGHICLDVIPKFLPGREAGIEELFKPGKLINVEEAAISTGGAVPNTGLALHRLGIKIELIGKIGDDHFGKIILDKLDEAVGTKGMSIVKGERTSYTIVISPPGIDRMFLHNPGANNTFGYEDIDFALVGRARLFHLGYPPLMRRLYENDGEELAKIYRKAKELGTTTSLDVALPDPNSPSGKVDWNAILKNASPFVDIFLPSAEEIFYMLEKEKCLQRLQRSGSDGLLGEIDGEDLTQLSDKMIELGVKIAVIKCGYRGFYVRTAGREKISQMGSAPVGDLDNWASRELWEPTYHVPKIASAAGSGDSAIAGFLASFLRGKTIEMALKYACTTGAQNLTVLDTVSGIKDWEETTRQVEENREKNRLSIGTTGWRFDEEGRVWIGPNN